MCSTYSYFFNAKVPLPMMSKNNTKKLNLGITVRGDPTVGHISSISVSNSDQLQSTILMIDASSNQRNALNADI